MIQRTFGNSDLKCSPIGFGTWAMSTTMYGDVDVDAISRAVNAAIDNGINLFDTAEVYGPYHAEEILGKALGSRRDEIVLVSKVGFNYEGRRVTGMNSKYDNIIERTEGCLKRLGTDVIDLMLIHWRDHDTPLDETMKALLKLKEDGKIRHYGVSNFDIPMMETCLEYGPLTANQVGYNIFDQRMDKEVLAYCQEKGIGFMGYGALAFGLLTGGLKPDTTFAKNDWRSYMSAFGLPLFERDSYLKELKAAERLAGFAADHGKTLPQLGIAWVLSNSAVAVALMGVRNEEELNENIAAADWTLTDSDKAVVNTILEEEGVPTYIDEPQALRSP